MVHNKACFPRALMLNRNTAKNLTKFVLIFRIYIRMIRRRGFAELTFSLGSINSFYLISFFAQISSKLIYYCNRVKWQHFILHGIRKSVCYAMSLTKQDIIHLHQHIPVLCAGFLVIGLNYA